MSIRSLVVFAAAMAALGVAPVTAAAPGAGLKVIAHPSVELSGISVDELRSVFLGTTTVLPRGGAVRPVLARGSATFNAFAGAFLNKTGAALDIYYRTLVFTGRGSIPPGFATDAEVVRYVARTPGAIGFVRDTAPAEQVKVLVVR